MGLSATPISERTVISFFGRVNVGKSSVMNAVVSQDLSIVSELAGTTTDPVKKTMELLPLGPVVLYDTPGFDDKTVVGQKRVEKTHEILSKTDIAVLVVDIRVGISPEDQKFIDDFNSRNIPYLVVYNKSDLAQNSSLSLKDNEIVTSTITGDGIRDLKLKIAGFSKRNETTKYIIKDKIQPKDWVVLVIPVDEGAPKGRLILPEQSTLRELLDNHNHVICCQPEELDEVIKNTGSLVKLVITDSQVFSKIKDRVPSSIFLTSFSILFARYKGNLEFLIQGVKTLSTLSEGSCILISEGCSHHRQCSDIGSVKIPSWIENFTGKKFSYEFSSGGSFPKDLSRYDLIVHCGGCMLNEKEMHERIRIVKESGKTMINYGILIAHMNGILKRALEIFPEILKML